MLNLNTGVVFKGIVFENATRKPDTTSGDDLIILDSLKQALSREDSMKLVAHPKASPYGESDGIEITGADGSKKIVVPSYGPFPRIEIFAGDLWLTISANKGDRIFQKLKELARALEVKLDLLKADSTLSVPSGDDIKKFLF